MTQGGSARLTMPVGISYLCGMDIDTLISLAGGVGKLAALCGVSHPAVSQWRESGTIPATRVQQIAELLDLPLADVITLASPPRRREVA